MFSRIRSADKLNIKKTRATRVFCARCSKHVFYLKRDQDGVKIANLAPLQGSPIPTDFYCPNSTNLILAYTPEQTLKTDRGLIK